MTSSAASAAQADHHSLKLEPTALSELSATATTTTRTANKTTTDAATAQDNLNTDNLIPHNNNVRDEFSQEFSTNPDRATAATAPLPHTTATDLVASHVKQEGISLLPTTGRDVSEPTTSSSHLLQQNPNPDTPLPVPDRGGNETSPIIDGLPSADHVDIDAVIADVPTLSTATPAEPVTPIQSHTRGHPSLSRRSSTVGPNAIPFASASEASRVRNAISNNSFNMMAFAQMSSPLPMTMGHIAPPSIVTPAQVTLPIPGEGVDGLPSAMHPLVSTEEGLESFARIEFADSVFQMTTYAVIIGRDQRAMEQAKRDERRAEEYRRIAEEHAAQGLPPPNPIMQERNRKFSKSYVSEEGGMLGPESDGESVTRPQKKRKRTRSVGSSQNDAEGQEEQLIMDRQYVSHTPGAAAVDLKSLRPSPHHTPFIGIHSPGPDIASKTKAISREHLKIQFNAEKNVFEAIPLHKNGFFCDDVHYRQDSVVLKSGARLQIKDVDFTFIINGVERGRTGAEDLEDGPKRRYSEGGKEMSVEFELGQAHEDLRSDSDELSELGSPPELSDDGEIKSESEDEETGKTKHTTEQPPKRRGPGRPPKDGIMSKRERRELNKREQEIERQRQMEELAANGEAPIKRKVGRPRKHPLPESADGKPEKRKYKPRKPKGEEEGSEAERRRERKERRLARPKSPPLKLRREDFTEEQLAKPNKNYGILIDEVLREAGPDGLILKQIYNRISAKYPFYHFCTETKGWESSVRHNLIGNSAFRKDPKSGAWTRVPGIELDAGKKRKGDAAAVERAAAAAAAAAAASAAAAVAGGQPYATAYGNHVYPGYGTDGHQLPPGSNQAYLTGGAAPAYQQNHQPSQLAFGGQQGDSGAQTYATPTGQHPASTDSALQAGVANLAGATATPQGVPPNGIASAGPQLLPGQVQPAQATNAQNHAIENGAGHNYALGTASSAVVTPGPAAQPNGVQGAVPVPGTLPTGPAQQAFYAAHAPGPIPTQVAPQQANGVGPITSSIQGQPSRPSVLPRPALMHPRLITLIKNGAKEMRKHPALDRRSIFSAVNRALALKPRHSPGSSKTQPLAETIERKLVGTVDGIVKSYFEAHPSEYKHPIHLDVVSLLVGLREILQKRVGQTSTSANGSMVNAGSEKDKESKQEKQREMGELMVLSCFDRLVGVMDESVFDWLKEEGMNPSEEEDLRMWMAAEAQLMPVVKGYITKMGFTLPT